MTLLKVDNLVKHFPIRGGILNRIQARVHAVNGVSFTIGKGEKVGLVGESGCGKSTLGKTIARIWDPTDGKISFEGTDISYLTPGQMRPYRQRLQFIFQDPYGSLNPKMTIFSILKEPLKLHKTLEGKNITYREEVARLIKIVGLPSDAIDKYPHEFSGGQRQRIGIARAIATNPSLIIADEPVSALDVSVQAQIINLMDDLRNDMGVAFLFISHDLKVVHHFCDRVMVMYLGNVVETLSTDHLYDDVTHPYTKALLGAIPADHPDSIPTDRDLLEGDVPSPINLPSGCAFHTRCPIATEACKKEAPVLKERKEGHWVSCHNVL
jgi:oligopeptide/dipeptide ABC transporter ATP-binding protein